MKVFDLLLSGSLPTERSYMLKLLSAQKRETKTFDEKKKKLV